MKRVKSLPKGEKILLISHYILLGLLILSFIFSLIRLIVTKDTAYSLTMSQSVIGIIVLCIPVVLDKKFKLDIPLYLKAILVTFVYLAIFLGEVKSFYYKYANWDMFLHTFSGMIFAILSFSLITLLNDNKSIHLQLSPIFVALFTFCFSVAVGVIWEIYEFAFDSITGSNMQKFIPELEKLFNNGNSHGILNGTDAEIAAFFRSPAGYKFALMDTMEDIIVDTIGALVISILGFVLLKTKSKHFEQLLIVKQSDKIEEETEVITSAEQIDSAEAKAEEKLSEPPLETQPSKAPKEKRAKKPKQK